MTVPGETPVTRNFVDWPACTLLASGVKTRLGSAVNAVYATTVPPGGNPPPVRRRILPPPAVSAGRTFVAVTVPAAFVVTVPIVVVDVPANSSV